MLRAVVTRVRLPAVTPRYATTNATAMSTGKEGDQRVEGWRHEDRYWEKRWKQTEPRRVDVDEMDKTALRSFRRMQYQTNVKAAQTKTQISSGRKWALALWMFVLGTYFYSMYAVKNETFLDNLDVPEPPVRKRSGPVV